MVLGTGIGDAGATAYATAANTTPEEFVTRFGRPCRHAILEKKLSLFYVTPNMPKVLLLALMARRELAFWKV